MNDTNRELGGALGVAVLGSLLAGHYSHTLRGVLAPLPAAAQDAARSSLGGALGVAGKIGNPALAAAARSAFTDAMGLALLVGGVVALVAAVAVAFVMPQRLPESEEQLRHGGDDREPVTTGG
jgi:hypothetical protein